jgi:hypothetical protein
MAEAKGQLGAWHQPASSSQAPDKPQTSIPNAALVQVQLQDVMEPQKSSRNERQNAKPNAGLGNSHRQRRRADKGSDVCMSSVRRYVLSKGVGRQYERRTRPWTNQRMTDMVQRWPAWHAV